MRRYRKERLVHSLELATPNGVVPAMFAAPDPAKHPGPYPAVVIVHDITGSGEDLQTHLQRLADYGYLALGPNLFAGGVRPLCIARAMRDLTRRSGPTVDTIDAARTWLLDRDDCTGSVGVIGFCIGGGFALLAATRGFEASAPFYGRIPVGQHDALADACPVVASFGRRDPTLPGAGKRLERTLTQHGIEHDVKTYDGVGHSFTNKFDIPDPLLRITGFAFDEQVAEDAWARVRVFFDQHLGPHNT